MRLTACKVVYGQLKWLLILITFLTVFLTNCRDSFVGDACICCQSLNGVSPILGGQTSQEPKFEWLPNGNQILYQDQEGKIFLVDLLSKRQIYPERVDELEGYEFDITPDGNQISLSTKNGEVGVYKFPTASLVMTIPNAFGPKWSPDSQVLAVGSSKGNYDQVEIIQMSISKERIPVIGSKHQSYYLESWSNSGSYLALTSTEPDSVAGGLAEKIEIFSLGTQEKKPFIDLAGCQQMLSWSPNDNFVTFAANSEGSWDIYLATLDQIEYQNLSNTLNIDEYQPMWSPDGELIVYVGFKPISRQSFEQDIYLVDPESYEIRRLTNTVDEYESSPKWSPTGNLIAYLSKIDDEWHLNIMDRNGNGQKRVATIGDY